MYHIEIPFAPDIIELNNFRLSWHGFLSVVAIILAVIVSVRGSRRLMVNTDHIYNLAPFAIVGGIIGARLSHVADRWDLYSNDINAIFRIWEGGIGLWGAILGGWLAGLIYAFLAAYPLERVGRIMDAIAPGMFVSQTVGRIGDVINGEHCSIDTNLIWGWFFSHPQSPGRFCITNSSAYSQGYFPVGTPEDTPVHPAVVYEMIWNVLGLGVLYFLRDRLTPRGSIWFIYLIWYSIGRFAIQWVRLDRAYFWNLQQAHIIAIIVLLIAIPIVAWKTRIREPQIVTKPI